MNPFLQYTLKLQDELTGKLNQAATNAGRVFDTMDNRTRPMKSSLAEIEKRMDGLRKSVKFSINTSDIKRAGRELDLLERQAEKIKGLGRKSGGSLMPSIGTAAAVAGAAAIGAQTIGAASDRESMKNVLNFTTGGKGAKALQELKTYSDKFGISLDASLQGFRTLSGSTISMGLKKQLDIFKGVSAGVSAMGLSADDAKGTFLALGQMASKGKVTAEELRGQIGERIPGAFEIAARAMGVTTAKLDDMMSKGEVASKDFLPKFAAEMERTFGGAAQKNINSSAANFARYNNVLLETKVAIGEKLLPIAITLLQKYVIPAVKWIGDHATQVLRVVGVVGSLIAVLKIWSTVQMAVNLVTAANPIGATIMAIMGLIAAITAVIVWIRKAREEGYNWWYIIKQINSALLNLVTAGIPAMISQMATGMRVATERGWKAVHEAIKKGASDSQMSAWMHNMGQIHGEAYRGAIMGKLRQVAAWFDNFYNTSYFSGRLDALGNSSKKASGFVVRAKRMQPSLAMGGAGSSDDSAKSAGSSKVKDTVDRISGGGARNTYISLGKFQDEVKIYVNSAKEGIDQMEAMLEQALLRVLNSANAVTY